MSRHRVDQVARALAWGFLAAVDPADPSWDEPRLRAAGRRVLGRRPRWLPRMVREVLARYPRPPLDRPGELAAALARLGVLQRAVDRAGRGGPRVRVRDIPTVAGTMGRRHWPVPEVTDLQALARLLEVPLEQLPWLADLRGMQRRTAAGPYHLYRYQWMARPHAVPRLLEAPTPLLRAVLRRLLTEILRWVPVHPAAHGFVRGRSALSHARRHRGADLVISLDLRTFFASIGAARVRGLVDTWGYPEAVAASLTGLVTHRTPIAVLAAMPAGGSAEERHRLRAHLRAAHLPQGAPTSPALANLVAYALDRRLAGYALAADLVYGRYADDLTFSGPRGTSGPRVVRAVDRIVAEEGFGLNHAKTRVRAATQRQLVTGVVVNAAGGVPREQEDRLRAVLHEAARHGVERANREGHPQFRAHLEGRVGWVESVNPARGARLRRQLESISWPEPS